MKAVSDPLRAGERQSTEEVNGVLGAHPGSWSSRSPYGAGWMVKDAACRSRR
ncbi:MAG: hypothetical protein MZV64_16780 [Ignavibacteriales bacterium]|nr:hypothetical protein [Ignavibacteriales bacterium]